MVTRIYTHDSCIAHDPGPGHPERPDRLRAVLRRLRQPDFAQLVWCEAAPATRAAVARAHDAAYVDWLLDQVPESGRIGLDGDTFLSPASGEAALLAAGAVCQAIDAVMAGKADNAFCAVRPPGHHAEAGHAMGFCLFNNIAIGAHRARAEHDLARVAMVDFDVHHGNGTQHMFERDPAFFFASTHQGGIYPGTGARDECGVGNVVNMPLPAMAGSADFRDAMTSTILPALAAFAPELVLISAGFDAHAADPLAMLDLQAADFAWATARILEVAASPAAGRVVSTLEGGYDLDALADCAAAHVGALLAAGASGTTV